MLNIYLCVYMCWDSASVSTGTSGAQKMVQDPVGLKFQVVLSCLTQVLGIKLRCSARVASALCWAISLAQICVFYTYIYTLIYFPLDTGHDIHPRNISRKHVKSQNELPFEAPKMQFENSVNQISGMVTVELLNSVKSYCLQALWWPLSTFCMTVFPT